MPVDKPDHHGVGYKSANTNSGAGYCPTDTNGGAGYGFHKSRA
jgi:hypothetical protein